MNDDVLKTKLCDSVLPWLKHGANAESRRRSAARRAANDECVDRLKRGVELPVGARFLREMSADDVDETLAIWRPGVPTEPIAHVRNGQVVESTQYVPTIWGVEA
jgi:hypothetical protein